MKKTTILFLLAAISLVACNSTKTSSEAQDQVNTTSFADTIIYDVIVKNPNPEDQWTTECLKHLELEGLLDELFEAVYNRSATAYDYFSDERIRPTKLKKMESEGIFQRSRIGKIQFTEGWYFDSKQLQFKKKVLSVVLGEELYDLDGGVRGYKPVFKVDLHTEY